MSGWLIAAWLLLAFVSFTIWFTISWSRLQRRVASQRPNLDRDSYILNLAGSSVSPDVAGRLYDALQGYSVKGVAPHPDDGLYGFYFDDPEEMEDLVEEMFERLELPKPKRYDPEITPHMESARALAVYLQQKQDGLSQFTPA